MSAVDEPTNRGQKARPSRDIVREAAHKLELPDFIDIHGPSPLLRTNHDRPSGGVSNRRADGRRLAHRDAVVILSQMENALQAQRNHAARLRAARQAFRNAPRHPTPTDNQLAVALPTAPRDEGSIELHADISLLNTSDSGQRLTSGKVIPCHRLVRLGARPVGSLCACPRPD